MIRSTNNAALDEALRALRNALVKCDGTADRRIARNNARGKALAALRRVRAVLDAEYPAIRAGIVRRPLKTTRGQLERMKRKGWRSVGSGEAARYALHGVPVQQRTHAGYFVPGWAVAVGLSDVPRLREAVNSPVARKAALAAEALR